VSEKTLHAPAPRAASAQPASPAQAAPPGPRAEQLLIALQLAADLLSTPFHFLVFAFTRRRHVAALQRALQESAR
jgi:hypothetical protein